MVESERPPRPSEMVPICARSLKSCLITLSVFLGKHNSMSYDQTRVIGRGRKSSRQKSLRASMKTLNAIGFPIADIKNLKPKHIQELVLYWVSIRLAPSTIQGNLSDLRTLSTWIGKPGIVLSAKEYVSDHTAVVVKQVPTEPKGWFEREVDIAAIFREVNKLDHRVATQLLLMCCFGLRAKEAATLKSWLADQGTHLLVTSGTKGGRERVIPITEDYQRAILEIAKKVPEDKTKSLIPSNQLYSSWYQHFYRIMRKVGVQRRLNVVPHGLRHSYASAVYEGITGKKPPVCGGSPDMKDDTVRLARIQVSEHLGHSRMRVTSGYIGGMYQTDPDPIPSNTDLKPSAPSLTRMEALQSIIDLTVAD